MPAWKVRELTGRATSRYGDIYAPIKYKGHLDELTRRVKFIARGTYRTKYTQENLLKFYRRARPLSVAKKAPQTAARQAKKTPIGRRINVALATPDPKKLETPFGVNDQGKVWKNSGSVYTFPQGFDKDRRLHLDDAAKFIRRRMEKYENRKWSDRLFCDGDLIQFFAWRGGRNL